MVKRCVQVIIILNSSIPSNLIASYFEAGSSVVKKNDLVLEQTPSFTLMDTDEGEGGEGWSSSSSLSSSSFVIVDDEGRGLDQLAFPNNLRVFPDKGRRGEVCRRGGSGVGTERRTNLGHTDAERAGGHQRTSHTGRHQGRQRDRDDGRGDPVGPARGHGCRGPEDGGAVAGSYGVIITTC